MIAPSNPFISIEPILAVPGIRDGARRPPRARRRRQPDRGRAGAARARGRHARVARATRRPPSGVAGLYRGAGGHARDRRRRRAGRGRGSSASACAPGVTDTVMRDTRTPAAPRRADARRRRARSVTDRSRCSPLPLPARSRPAPTWPRWCSPPRRRCATGDVVVIAHKAVAKSEGRVVDLADGRRRRRGRSSSPVTAAIRAWPSSCCARAAGSSAAGPALLIAETHHGFVCASAGIDRSNGPAAGWAVLLPVDPDASAARLRRSSSAAPGARSPWSSPTRWAGRCGGIVGTAIGVSGLDALRSYAGTVDPAGYELRTTAVAVADELAVGRRPRARQARTGAGRADPRLRRGAARAAAAT